MTPTMTSWQLVRLIAGLFILLSLALGEPGSPVFASTWWLAFTAFVGANLLQSALTRLVPDGGAAAQARRRAGLLTRPGLPLRRRPNAPARGGGRNRA